MIDEKKLNRDDLCDICRCADCANCFSDEDFEKWIDNQPKVGEWIPVSERLPNINGIVLVQRGTYAECKGKPIIDIAKFTNRKTGFFEREKGFYQAWYSMPFKYDDVIAWQPLPEPYKGELV